MRKTIFLTRDNHKKEGIVIIFNKYLTIPNKDVKSFEHNYVDDILTIKLKNKQTIIINNFTIWDFNQIEHRHIIIPNKTLYGKPFDFIYTDFEKLGDGSNE